MIRRGLYVLAACLALLNASSAHAANCSATVSNINFGAVNVHAGAVNQTSGTIQVTCSGALDLLIGICVRFGPGSGGAGASNSPRYMRRGDGAGLLYELRALGNGAAFGTMNEIHTMMPLVLGSGSISIPFYADIVSPGVAIGTGNYSSTFSGIGDIELAYGVANCNLLENSTTIPSFEVSAEVVASCEIDAGSLAFGDVSTEINQPVDADSAINVSCTDTTPYTLSLDMGSGGGSDPSNRKMKNLLSSLNYGIYMDSARTQAWGSLPGATVSGIGTGLNQSYPVYGRIPAGQTAAVGIYTDSVLVTVSY
ncbi:MAG: Csu type fimbrial protein [Paracoccaceae bacterium]